MKTIIQLEKRTETLMPHKVFIIGIYLEKKQWVVRKYEILDGARVLIDEQYALNIEDAIAVQNIIFHEIHNFQIN